MRRRSFMKAAAAGASVPALVGGASGRAEAIEVAGHCILESPEGDFTTTDVEIESWDGTTIAATLYEPGSGGPHPAILMTHGWSANRGLLKCMAARYANNGYVVLAYDSRGFGDSGGLVRLNGPKEQKDASALIDWLADHDNVVNDGPNNPRLGMDGASYAGGIQLLAAAKDDRIDAIVPRLAWNDLENALAPDHVIKITWLSILLGIGELSSRFSGDIRDSLDPRLADWYFQALETNEPPEGILEAAALRSPSRVMEEIDAPALIISGWNDTLFPPSEAVANYQGLRDNGVESRLIMYEGGHALEEIAVSEKETRYLDEMSLAWLDRHVRGESAPEVPEVSLFDRQQQEWTTYSDFPPSGAEDESLDLQDLAGDRSSNVRKRFWFSDRTAEFEVEVSEDTEVIGTPELEVWVEPRGPEARLYVDVYHVSGGDETHINGQPTAFRVNGSEPQKETVDLEPFQRSFSAGDKIRVEIYPSNGFFIDSRTSDGTTIHHSSSRQSTVDFPVVSGQIQDDSDDGSGGGGSNWWSNWSWF